MEIFLINKMNFFLKEIFFKFKIFCQFFLKLLKIEKKFENKGEKYILNKISRL